ncbi:MAG: hypothetical protein EWV88_13490 [Microcystis wesenbergii Mw_MB_S_20031200_S109D]|uniref:Uncharacterized protein n=1 Tax=Microcystis wesenbergii Mw_MB_S_20031200_S109D TaxID=2486241 RepID=A0A552LQD7_9CHRO|nr:MAG: hypothetical protein EWV88_13490 [Microcystis wesenbergii Mw_MB_S_20031200_S109D]
MTSYDAGNSNNWQSVWNQSFTAEPAPGDRPELERYFPLPEISVPIQLSSGLLAFFATSQSADPKWKFAANVKRKYFTGLTVGGNPDAVVDNKRIFLNQFSLLRYPVSFGSSYSLLISVPYWIRQITLYLWEYTGPVSETSDPKIDQILQVLTEPNASESMSSDPSVTLFL